MKRTCICGGQVVTLVKGQPDSAECDILISADGRIEAIGPDLSFSAETVIDAAGMIVMPGFVNAHIHTWQTGLRGIAVDWTLGQYLNAMHAGLATHFQPEDVEIANRVGLLHQLHAGVTTIADWCHNNPTPAHTDAAIDGLKAAGGRAVFLHGSPKPDPKPGQPHFSEIPMPRSEVERLLNGALSKRDALVTLGLAVLGPQLSNKDVAIADLRLAQEFGLTASMHISGPMLWPEGFAKLNEMGLLGPSINITHGNTLSDADLRRLVEVGVSFSITPEVELQMGFGQPLTNRLRNMGGNAQISIGTDIESAMAGEMFSVTRFTLQAARHETTRQAKLATGKPPADTGTTTREALEWATIGGARMLGLDREIGTLEVGKQADIVLVNTNAINMRPVHSPIASLAFHAGPQNVDTVLVGGRIVKQGGVLLGQEMEPLLEQLVESGCRIMRDFAQATKDH